VVSVRPRIHAVAHPEIAQIFDGKPGTFASYIATQTLLHDGGPQQWRRWLEVATGQTPAPHRNLSFSNASICIEAALLRQGVALANDVLVKTELAAGGKSPGRETCIHFENFEWPTPKSDAT
jgi:DNA-binding transcriptional LysR family regulator